MESFVPVENASQSDETLTDDDETEKGDPASAVPEVVDEAQQAQKPSTDGKLILAEEVAQGGGVRAASKLYTGCGTNVSNESSVHVLLRYGWSPCLDILDDVLDINRCNRIP